MFLFLWNPFLGKSLGKNGNEDLKEVEMIHGFVVFKSVAKQLHRYNLFSLLIYDGTKCDIYIDSSMMRIDSFFQKLHVVYSIRINSQAVLQASERVRISNLVWLEECGRTSFESHSVNRPPDQFLFE